MPGQGVTREASVFPKGKLAGKASLKEALKCWALTDDQEFCRQTLRGIFRELSCDSHTGLGEYLVT